MGKELSIATTKRAPVEEIDMDNVCTYVFGNFPPPTDVSIAQQTDNNPTDWGQRVRSELDPDLTFC